MATSPIRPQFVPSPSAPAPAAKPAREALARPASVQAPAVARPVESLEVQLARIFARHAMQARQAAQPGESPKAASGRTRGANLDIHA